MSLFVYILFCIMAYRQASGKAHYNRVLLWMAYILTLGTVFIVSYWGYSQNPGREKLKFREVL